MAETVTWVVANKAEGIIAQRPTRLAAKAVAFERYLSPREQMLMAGLYKVFSNDGTPPVYVIRMTAQMLRDFKEGKRKFT